MHDEYDDDDVAECAECGCSVTDGAVLRCDECAKRTGLPATIADRIAREAVRS